MDSTPPEEKTLYKDAFLSVKQTQGRFVTIDRNKTQTGAICIPVTPDNKIILIKEFRIGANKELLSVVKGACDYIDESPIDVCIRELSEEIGAIASDYEITPMNVFGLPSLSKTNGRVVIARGCEITSQQHLEDGEKIKTLPPFSIDEVRRMLLAGDIEDAESVSALSYYLLLASNS
ncbi:NUDIX hydrolase [Photobacterium kishitanii]|uniref:Nudix hydrolase domain-containing protein n=1 Tax=Photobacterium kishitanii TaxID=318456 RepID=A0A2T3KLW5_9GAMM|nr:NUDIX hydrolase [Photobacterium kishitanii]PSV00681.1 hypothetical protein C9J27_05950 [Photobacterium kishitanii]